MNYRFTAVVYWEEDVYVAECPEVGTVSQGDTIESAINNRHLQKFYFCLGDHR